MTVEFIQVDVFALAPYSGNPLAVFPDAGKLTDRQMQMVAREMNLSESIFVTAIRDGSYDVRIFTPYQELPFAGHPTVGCAWLLAELGLVQGDEVVQHSGAGATSIKRSGTEFWFDRRGEVREPEEEIAGVARALGARPEDLTIEWDGVELLPAVSDAGLPQLMVPVRDLEVLEGLVVPASFGLDQISGAYCFTRTEEGIRARGLFPGVGVPEDPATGSAAAALGLYLDRHTGAIETTIVQGVEIGRPSVIRMRASDGIVSIGGSCRRVLKGLIEALP